jgi:hypothetical protein
LSSGESGNGCKQVSGMLADNVCRNYPVKDATGTAGKEIEARKTTMATQSVVAVGFAGS